MSGWGAAFERARKLAKELREYDSRRSYGTDQYLWLAVWFLDHAKQLVLDEYDPPKEPTSLPPGT